MSTLSSSGPLSRFRYRETTLGAHVQFLDNGALTRAGFYLGQRAQLPAAREMGVNALGAVIFMDLLEKAET